jgi:transcriptional regulator with XRE-family HTH domain
MEDLGHLAEVNWTTIGKIERGASSPSVESIIRIASALEIDPGKLISGITPEAYGERTHQLTARELINARLGRDPLH